MTANPIFCALDVVDIETATSLATALKQHVGGFKIGLQLYCAAGPKVVSRLSAFDLPVFLDVKLHDIPNTVANAIRALAVCSPSFITVHAAGGEAMLKAALDAAENWQIPPTLLSVTVLTSLDDADLAAIGVLSSMLDQVFQLTELTLKCGLNAIVCSPQEIAPIRQRFGDEPILMVPGVRPIASVMGDQKRTLTPRQAILAGASHLVIGRPITGAADPAIAAREIAMSLASDP